MSRFLDQIRKAKEARERASQQAAGAGRESEGDGAELVPDIGAHPASSAVPKGDASGESLFPSSARSARKRRAESDTPSDLEHFPSCLESGFRSGKPESAPQVEDALLSEEMTESGPAKAPKPLSSATELVPPEMSESRPPKDIPVEWLQTDLVPQEKSATRSRFAMEEEDLVPLEDMDIMARSKAEALREKMEKEAEEFEDMVSAEILPSDMLFAHVDHITVGEDVDTEQDDLDLIPPNIADGLPREEELDQEPPEEVDLSGLEAEITARSQERKPKPIVPVVEVAQEEPQPEMMSEPAQEELLQYLSEPRKKNPKKCVPEMEPPEERSEPPREPVDSFSQANHGSHFEERTDDLLADLPATDLLSAGPVPRPERKSRKPLFPSELSGKKTGRTERVPESSFSSLLEDDDVTIFPSSEIESDLTAPRRKHRRRKIRGEVPIPGPDPDEEYVKRIAKIAPRPDKRILSFYDPQNHVCEEYRLLGKNILHTFASTPGNSNLGKVVTLTSSTRGEGKTLTSVNLAMTLSQDLSDRVLLMDGDLRHPKVHRYMGVPSGSGLNDLLVSSDPESIIEDCMLRTDTGLHLLMSSSFGRNPASLLDSNNMNRIFDLLRARYALIIVDTPPVLLATDALTLGVKSDGMLFLLRARKTQREQIQEARQRIARLEIRMLGYVINNVRSFLPQIWRKYYYGNY